MLRALFNRGTSLRNAATRSLRGTAARFRSPLSAKAVGFGTSVVTVAGMGFTISSFRGEAVAEAKGEQEQVKDLKHYQEFHKELMEKYENLDILPLTAQGLALHTIIRDRVTARDDFVFYSNRIIRLLIEQALSKLPFAPSVVMTPTAVPFYGLDFRERVVGVSIMRAGDSMVAGLRSVAKGVRIGKVLIQRDEEDPEKRAHLSYVKFPGDIARRHVLLLDPMLATGVAEERITFVNVVTTPEGIDGLFQAYPKIKVVTSFVDPGMNDMKYILPGLGDFGDRYFGTEEDQHGRRTFTYH